MKNIGNIVDLGPIFPKFGVIWAKNLKMLILRFQKYFLMFGVN